MDSRKDVMDSESSKTAKIKASFGLISYLQSIPFQI